MSAISSIIERVFIFLTLEFRPLISHLHLATPQYFNLYLSNLIIPILSITTGSHVPVYIPQSPCRMQVMPDVVGVADTTRRAPSSPVPSAGPSPGWPPTAWSPRSPSTRGSVRPSSRGRSVTVCSARGSAPTTTSRR